MILKDVKEMLGIANEIIDFDSTLINIINTVIFTLYQIDEKSKSPIVIDETSDWDLYKGQDLNSFKTLVYLKTRLIFDPPTNNRILDSINSIISELEWRFQAEVI